VFIIPLDAGFQIYKQNPIVNRVTALFSFFGKAKNYGDALYFLNLASETERPGYETKSSTPLFCCNPDQGHVRSCVCIE
jgi:hypothetical protein